MVRRNKGGDCKIKSQWTGKRRRERCENFLVGQLVGDGRPPHRRLRSLLGGTCASSANACRLSLSPADPLGCVTNLHHHQSLPNPNPSHHFCLQTALPEATHRAGSSGSTPKQHQQPSLANTATKRWLTQLALRGPVPQSSWYGCPRGLPVEMASGADQE